MKKLVIIADDLSGANDAGAQVLLQGFTTCSLNTITSKHGANAEVKVYNSSTRLLSSIQAYNKVKKLAFSLKEYDQIYKKTDSTLRGNIGAELDGCIDALKTKRAAFVSAFPVLRRYSAYGRLFLGSKVLENTEFAKDACSPIGTSNILELIKTQSKYQPVLVDLDLIRNDTKAIDKFISEQGKHYKNKIIIFIFDCVAEKDLKVIARSLKDFKIIAGAAALIKYLLPKKRPIISRDLISTNTGQAVFIGSTKNTTLKQLIMLRKYLSARKDTECNIFSAGGNQAFNLSLGKDINTKFAQNVRKLINEGTCGKIILSGGATAENIFRALRINYTVTLGTIQTGVPLTYSPERNIYIVTKPGGYGDKRALISIYNKLKELR